MADLERLKRALQAAHAAGDTAAATNLAKAIRASQSVPTNPEGTGVGRAIKRGAVQTAATVPTMLATADLRALTDVNRSPGAIRYDEALRSGVPNQAFASRAASMSDPKQVNSMMQQYGVSPQANINYQQVVQKRIENREDAAKNPAEYLKRLSANSETAGRLFKLAESFERSPTADAYAQSLAEAPDSFMGWLGTVTDDPLGFMAFMGETIAESVPQIAAGAATSTVTGSPVAGAAVMSLGGLGREYANEVNNFLRKNGVDLSDPEATKKLFSNKSLMDEANERGLTRGLVVAAADFAGQGLVAQQIIRKTLKRQTVAQGGSEAAGEALATQAVGDDFSAKDTIIEGLAGAGSIFGEATVSRTLFNKDGKLKKPESLDDTQRQSAGDLARTFKAITDANPDFNLNDVNKTSAKGARAVVDQAHIQLTEALKQRFADMKALVKPNQTDTFESVSEKILASAAYREGRNKTKSIVGNQELDALKRLAGDTREGQEAVNLILQLNQLTELHNSGYQGGLSSFTDQFSVFGSKVGYDKSAVATERLLRPLVTGSAALKTGGLSLIGQGVTSISGRAIDKLTGNYSQIDKFVRRNAETPGLSAPTAPSLRDAAAAQIKAEEDATQREETLRTAREAEQRELNLQFARDNADPTQGSPQYTLEDATGLGRAKVAQILRILKGQNKNSALIRAIQDYEQSIATGGIVDDKMLSPLIRAVREFQQSNPDYVPLDFVPNSRSRPEFGQFPTPEQTAQLNTQGIPTPDIMSKTTQFGPKLTIQENYNRGIEANKEMNAELVEGVTTDPELNRVQKGRLITSLDVLANNLGSDPVAPAQEQVQKLEDAGVPAEAVEKYIQPYVDRVVRQQEARDVGPRMAMAPQEDGDPSKPALQSYVNPLQLPEDEIDVTRLNSSPSEADIQKMREGTYKPKQKRTLVEAADYMHQKWKAATGRDEPFEYTPENVDIISTYMATEAANALQSDANAIGWYDRKLKAAKRVVSLVDPRVTQSSDAEAAFDFALAVTSNGQAVADNFQYALEVFRHFMDNGQMPTTTWKKGGERNAAMVEAFDFFNAYQASGTNMPIQDLLDQDFTVNELNDYIARFNAQYGTNIKVPSSEGANADVKGSYIIGPKIGQGFYQNIRGNYDPLTMDIWWMRMWNRLVGRPFEANKDLDKNRARVREALQTKNQDALERRLTKETLKDMGITRADLKKNGILDEFVLNLESRYQSFYRQESKRLKGTGQKVPKPELANATGTMKRNLSPQLQGTPKGPGERAYMREVTKAAIVKLRDLGYDIETADFQALMWYPEKQLFRHLGVAPGRGADNDYLDAAIMLAEGEGITNDQIQEALPDADGDGAVNNQSGTPGVDEGLYRGPSGTGSGQARAAKTPVESNVAGVLSQRIQGRSPARSTVPSTQEVKQAAELVRKVLSVGLTGSETENGIKNIDEVHKLADVVGITLHMTDNVAEILEAAGYDPAEAMGSRMLGVYTPSTSTAYALNPSENLSEFDSYITALHEVAHAINDMSGDAFTETFGEFNMKNPMTEVADTARRGSFDAHVAEMLLMHKLGLHSAKDKKAQAERKQIITEMRRLQDKGKFDNGRDVRYIGGAQSRDADRRDTPYYKYIRNAPEFAVDALSFYIHNPKRMKVEYPATAKMIRRFFKNSGKINFYSHPLAMAVAVVLASMLKAEQEEEQKKQMPPGALNAPMASGMLSAQQA